jgi:hypothetical protein
VGCCSQALTVAGQPFRLHGTQRLFMVTVALQTSGYLAPASFQALDACHHKCTGSVAGAACAVCMVCPASGAVSHCAGFGLVQMPDLL